MNSHPHPTKKSAFTLMETVIAIGVIAVLVTGFIAVFAPAVDGIRRSISIEEANRLASTLERELVTLRQGQQPTGAATGFEKAFEWIRDSDQAGQALLIYQYRGVIGSNREDETPRPYTQTGGVAGRDFITVPMVRRKSDARINEDLAALEGRAFVVRCVQLVKDSNGNLVRGTAGSILNSGANGSAAAAARNYDDAVLAFSAEFFNLPNRDPQFLSGAGFDRFFNERTNRPMFTRNLAVRR